MALYESIEPEFNSLFNRHARLDRLYMGCKWAEGPAWFGGGRYLIWSDIVNNRMLRYDDTNGGTSVFRQPSNNSNGNTTDDNGRLVTCEQGGRRISRTEHDGTITLIADRFEGKRLNSPNDVVVKSDGSIWFTDPTYGIDSDYEGNKGDSEIGSSNVYRVDGANGKVEAVITDMVRPNGLAFSPDEGELYVGDTGRTLGPEHPSHIRRFKIGSDGRPGASRVFAEASEGLFDGFRFDSDGRLWTSAEDGVHCYKSNGALIGKILAPEVAANCVFGGSKRNRLFICATTSLYAVYLTVNGAKAG